MKFAVGLLAAGDGGMKLTYVWNHATAEAQVIIVLLAIFSVFAWMTMGYKAVEMRRAKRLNHFFDTEFRQQKSVLDIHKRKLEVEGCPLFAVYETGCTAIEGRIREKEGCPPRVSLKAMEHVKSALEATVARESLRLESGLVRHGRLRRRRDGGPGGEPGRLGGDGPRCVGGVDHDGGGTFGGDSLDVWLQLARSQSAGAYGRAG
jgi:hypothetical protein